MIRHESKTKRHILEVTASMLDTLQSSDLHVVDIAEGANVAIQTLYYHFGSLRRLVAEAQCGAYLKFVEPLHLLLQSAEIAVLENDEEKFWDSVGDDVMMAWSYGAGEQSWRINAILNDVRRDPEVHREFGSLMDIQIARWIKVLEAAKSIGWLNPMADTHALVASCWAGSNGQAIFSRTKSVQYSARTIRDFWVEVARSKR